MNQRLIRNPTDRDLIRVVAESRFIASSDLAIIDGRHAQVVSVALKTLSRARHVRRLYSAQRLKQTTFAGKTYIYQIRKTPTGHVLHWLHVAHMRALFTRAARDLELDLHWSQSTKHRNQVPDAIVGLPAAAYSLEVDNGTERLNVDRLAGKLVNPQCQTLVVTFSSEKRLRTLSGSVGKWDKTLITHHGYFHELEPRGFNILTEKAWWNGSEWVAIL